MSDDKKSSSAVQEAPEAAEAGNTNDEFEVPGYVALDKELPGTIAHFPLRANETWRPVLPGENEQRKHWAMRQFTARRILFIAACAILSIYFFLLINHLRLHRSYPVNFPDIDIAKYQVRAIADWTNAIGNIQLKEKDLRNLLSVADTEQLQALGTEMEEIAQLDKRTQRLRKKEFIPKIRELTLDDVVDYIEDPALQAAVMDIRTQVAAIPEVPYEELEQQIAPGILPRIKNLPNGGLQNMLKLELIASYTERKTASIDYIRDRDQFLRIRYFTLADKKYPAALLFMLSCIMFVAAARLRWVYQPDTPMPTPDVKKGEEQDRLALLARWGIVILAFMVAISGIILMSHGKEAAGQQWRDYLAAKQAAIEEAKAEYLKLTFTEQDFAAASHQIRGVDSHGSYALSVPEAWDNPLWEAGLPLDGLSQPLIWRNWIFVAGADAKEQKVFCYDRANGKLLWDAVVPRLASAEDLKSLIDDGNIYQDKTWGTTMLSASSPATDGKRIYVFFPTGEVAALNPWGELLWNKFLGIPQTLYGHSQSLLVHDGKLLVPWVDGGEQSGVFCLNGEDGSQLWHSKISGGDHGSWTTPVIRQGTQGPELVIPSDKLYAISLTDGAPLWEAIELSGENGPSPAVTDELLIMAQKDCGAWGIKPDGSVAWSLSEGNWPDYPSVISDGVRWWSLDSGGSFSCHSVVDGKQVYAQDVIGNFSAAPLLLERHLVLANFDGQVTTLRAGSQYEEGPSYEVGATVMATPAAAAAITIDEVDYPPLLLVRAWGKLIALPLNPATGAEVEPLGEIVTVVAGKEPVQAADTVEVPAVPAEPFLVKPAAGLTGDKGFADDASMQWFGFRGPGMQNLAWEDFEGPDAWDKADGDNIAWQVSIPHKGIGQPVVWDDQIFISASNGVEQLVICYGAEQGDVRWSTVIPGREGEPAPKVYDPATNRASSEPGTDTYMYAAGTPVTDGHRVYAIYANGDLACLDMDGQILWVRDFGIPKNNWGQAQSLVRWQDKLFVAWDHRNEDTALYALDPVTGAEIWKVRRDPKNDSVSYSTPLPIQTSRYGRQLVTMAKSVVAYNPDDGQEIWRYDGLTSSTGPSPVFAQEKIYATMKRKGMHAIKTNGTGNITESHFAWKDVEKKAFPEMPSPVSDGRKVWTLAGKTGTITCYDVQTGDVKYSGDLGKQHYATPLLVGGRLLCIATDGTATWVNATTETLVTEPAGTLADTVMSSPALWANSYIIRGETTLYRITEKE